MLVALRLHVGGHLHAELLEGHRSGRVVGDPGVAALPLDGVVGIARRVVKCRRMPMPIRSGAMAMRAPSFLFRCVVSGVDSAWYCGAVRVANWIGAAGAASSDPDPRTRSKSSRLGTWGFPL